MKCLRQILIAAAAFLILGFAASAQQAPPTKSPPAKPKAKRVWTNDDVGTLRKPVDEYEDAKRKQADEEAAKKAEAAKTAAETPGEKPAPKPEDFLPKTVEEGEKRVAAKQYEIEMQYEAIELVKKEQAEATTEESRAAFQKRIDTLTATLEEAIGELRATDARLKELKSKPPAPPKPEPSKP